jgi:hypothetical protein
MVIRDAATRRHANGLGGRIYILSGLVDSFLFFVAHQSIYSDLPAIFVPHTVPNFLKCPEQQQKPLHKRLPFHGLN